MKKTIEIVRKIKVLEKKLFNKEKRIEKLGRCLSIHVVQLLCRFMPNKRLAVVCTQSHPDMQRLDDFN